MFTSAPAALVMHLKCQCDGTKSTKTHKLMRFGGHALEELGEIWSEVFSGAVLVVGGLVVCRAL